MTETDVVPMLTVPDCWVVSEFPGTDTFTVPPPETSEGLTVIQSSAVTEKVHADGPSTLIVFAPPPLSNDSDVGETPGPAGHGTPSCVTETDVPPMVTVPDRLSVLVFSVTSTVTLPSPDTLDSSTEIQVWSSLTVYEQLFSPFNVTSFEPPPLPNDSDMGETPGAVGHSDSGGCVKLKVAFPKTTVPVRSAPVLFADAVYVTVFSSRLTVIHESSEAGPMVVPQASDVQFKTQMLPGGGGVHVHETEKVPEPPAAGTVADVGDTL